MVQEVSGVTEIVPMSHSIEIQNQPDNDGLSSAYVESSTIKPENYPDSTIYVEAEAELVEEVVEPTGDAASTIRRQKHKEDPKYNMIYREDSKKQVYKCCYCPKECNYASRLKLHIRTHTGEKPFPCPMCPFRASYKKSVEIHMRSHTGEKPYSCSICSFRAARKANVDDHMRIHTGEKPFKCPICDFRSAQQSAVTCHIRRHTGEKRFACPTCEFRTAYKHILEAHVRVHTGERPFHCSFCSYRGTTKLNVKLHMRKHTGEKPYACTMCNFRSTKRYAVKLHMRRHTGERPFACPECDYTASQKFSLQKHMKRHTGAAPFSCPDCGFRCVNEKALSVHMKKHQRQQFACAQCGCTLKTKIKFVEHLQQNHQIWDKKDLDFYCTTQLIEIENEVSLRAPSASAESITHFFQCDECEFSTTSQFTFEQHSKVHVLSKKPDRHLCPICNLAFVEMSSLASHIKISHPIQNKQKKKQVYVCPAFCSGTFQTKSALTKHIRKNHPDFSVKKEPMEPHAQLEVIDDLDFFSETNVDPNLIVQTEFTDDEGKEEEEECPPPVNSWGKVVCTGEKGTVITTRRIIISKPRLKR